MSTSNYLKTEKVTLSHQYPDSDTEFVFAFKGQPFASAVTNSTPTSTLIDFGMVRDFKMKMTDFKCQKFTFANQKLRIVGKVSSFVQYIKDGAPIGQYKFAATVVRGLTEALDVDSIAGIKLVSQLTGKSEDAKPSPVLDAKPSPEPDVKPDVKPSSEPDAKPVTKASPKKCEDASQSVPAAVPGVQPIAAPAAPPGPAQVPPVPPAAGATAVAPSTPPRTSPSAAARSPRSPRSPPGFPATPQHAASLPAASCATETRAEATIPVQRVMDGTPLSPFSANVMALSETFNDADLVRDKDEQMKILEDVDSDGDVDFDEDEGSYIYRFTNGLQYTVGHGRHGCSRKKCPKTNLNKKKTPSNCGYHPQWALPDGFRHCGDKCKAAFCPCLRLYHGHKGGGSK